MRLFISHGIPVKIARSQLAVLGVIVVLAAFAAPPIFRRWRENQSTVNRVQIDPRENESRSSDSSDPVASKRRSQDTLGDATRERMVESQLRGRDIEDERTLKAMARVARHAFVPQARRDQSYDDKPLPIGHGQTISQPYMVALMTQLAAPDHVPQPLIDQLAPGGRMILPVGRFYQELLVIEKGSDGNIRRRTVAPVTFVPMTGEAQKRGSNSR